jgi:putative PEP-CTERM system histidine kinase
MTPAVDTLGYVAAAIAFSAVLALTLPSYPGTRQAGGLIGAIVASAVWAIALAAAVFAQGGFAAWMLIVDAVRDAVWILFVAWFLATHSPARQLARTLGLAAISLCVLTAVSVVYQGVLAPAEGQAVTLPLLGLPLLGLLGLEQLYRNSVFEQRRALRLLCVGIGVIFAVDVFVFSQALLFAQVDGTLWALRGYANVAAAPLLLLAIKQQPDWGRGVFVSRHVVFYSTSLVAAGLYLLAMAAGGFLIAATGVPWGVFLQLIFFACASGFLLYALFSVSLRRRLKVFIAKHFYRNRYDYREEWLRLMQTLVGGDDAPTLSERSVRALGDIVEAQHGRLWLEERDGGRLIPHGAWRVSDVGSALASDDPLVRFMRETHWVVDTEEYVEAPDKYSNAFNADSRHLTEPAVFVPLIHAGALIGIVALERPSGLGRLTYEDHDLLKTAGQQVAIFLQQERTQEALSETRQFEAFTRLTAFLMHDLKNLIAQQELVVRNAQRFKHRPEFIEDAIKTVESGVHRMRRVLERLQGAARPEHRSLVDVGSAVQEVCRTCSDRMPVPTVRASGSVARVAADREKLCMAILHAIRNAQDATPIDGAVTVTLSSEPGRVRIEVADTGCGMDPEFVRSELFKPFHSTKGAKGMGIGAYQIRETMQAAGGDVEVNSEPGVGTTLCMWLPSASEPAMAGQSAA